MHPRRDRGRGRPRLVGLAGRHRRQSAAARVDHHAHRGDGGGHHGRGLVDHRAHRGGAGRADDVAAGDQRSQPVGGVDDLGGGDPGHQVLRAPGEADHLVGEDRAEHQHHVVLDDGAVEPHVDPGGEQPAGQLGDPLVAHAAETGERRGIPPGVLDHGGARPPGAEVTARPAPAVAATALVAPVTAGAAAAAEVHGQGCVAHRGMGAQGHQHGGARDPTGGGGVHGVQQQRQRARAGGVGHQHAQALAPFRSIAPRACSTQPRT